MKLTYEVLSIYIEHKVVNKIKNQKFNVSELFTSENAEISVVIDLKNSVEVSVKTVKSVTFQICDLIKSLLSK